MSSGEVFEGVSGERVEVDEELSHAGDEGHLEGFVGRAQAQVLCVQRAFGRAHCAQRGHVKRAADADSAVPARAHADVPAALRIERGHARERGDFSARERTQLGQRRDERRGGLRSDAAHAREALEKRVRTRVRAKELPAFLLELPDRFFIGREDLFERLSEESLLGGLELTAQFRVVFGEQIDRVAQLTQLLSELRGHALRGGTFFPPRSGG